MFHSAINQIWSHSIQFADAANVFIGDDGFLHADDFAQCRIVFIGGVIGGIHKGCPYVGSVRRGDPCGRPICSCPICDRPIRFIRDDDNSVNVIQHHDKFIQFDIRKSVWQSLPFRLYHVPRVIQTHRAIHDFSEQTQAMLRRNRHVVRAFLRIIISLQSN
jgi:hypothetical protein